MELPYTYDFGTSGWVDLSVEVITQSGKFHVVSIGLLDGDTLHPALNEEFIKAEIAADLNDEEKDSNYRRTCLNHFNEAFDIMAPFRQEAADRADYHARVL